MSPASLSASPAGSVVSPLDTPNTFVVAHADTLYPPEPGRLNGVSPFDPSEANQIAKFVFYFGYELLAAHPSLRAASMLGRAGFSVLSIAESASSSDGSQATLSLRSNTSLRSNSSLYSSDRSSSANSEPAAPDDLEPQTLNAPETNPVTAEAKLDQPLAARTAGKLLSISGDTTAALGYIAGSFNASLLSVILLDTGFAFLTVNCFLQSYMSFRETLRSHECLAAVDKLQGGASASALLQAHFTQHRNASLWQAISLAGYGAAFVVSYVAPYTALALFLPFIATDYGGKFAFNSVREKLRPEAAIDQLANMQTEVLSTVLFYLDREKSIFSAHKQHTHKPRPHAVLKALISHEHNKAKLRRQLAEIVNRANKPSSGDRISDQVSDKSIAATWPHQHFMDPLGITETVDVPSLSSEQVLALTGESPTAARSLDFAQPAYTKRVREFLRPKPAPNETVLQEGQDDDEGAFDNALLLNSLNGLGLAVAPHELQLAQLYDRAFEQLTVTYLQRVDCFDVVAKAIRQQVLSASGPESS